MDANVIFSLIYDNIIKLALGHMVGALTIAPVGNRLTGFKSLKDYFFPRLA